MKVLENKVTELRSENGLATYGDLVKVCMNQPVQGGLPVNEIRKRLRVLDVVEKPLVAEYQFEDADAKTLQSCVAAMRWMSPQRAFVEFSDDVASMTAASVLVNPEA